MNAMRAVLLTPILLAACAIPAVASAEDADTADWGGSLDEIVVTATRAPKLLKDTPVQTRLISRKDIERTDATDIRDLLQQEMPGIEFSYAMNQQVHLNFNGQGGQSVLFLVDGERLAGETMDDIDFSRIDMAAVDHIEIVKGSSSALYGSNAGGGVINIITRKAVNPWRVTADARVARHNEQRYNLALSLKGRHLRNILSANYNSTDNYNVHNAPDPATRVVTTIYGSRVWNFNERLTYTPSENLRISGRAGYFFRQLSRTADSPERYRDYSAGLRAEWNISPEDVLSISYSFDQYDKSTLYRRSGLDVRSYSNVQNSLRALYNHTFGRNILTAGADVMRDYLSNTKLTDPVRHQVACDAFGQFDWLIDDRWEVVGALRYDHFSDGNNSRLTPKISARYRPARNVNVRFGYGMGFRAPTLKEKYYEFDMAGIWIVKGNDRLKAESSHNLTLSCDYTHAGFNYTLSAYFNDINNKISTGIPYYAGDDSRQLYLDYINLSHCHVWGAEATVQARFSSGLSFCASYAFTDERFAKDKNGNAVNTQYIPARKHTGTVRISYDKSFSRNYGLSASLSGRVFSKVENIEYKDYYDISQGTVTVRYPGYSLWKLSLVQSIGRYVKISLAVDNLLNYKPKYYYLNCPLTDGANFMAGVSLDIY